MAAFFSKIDLHSHSNASDGSFTPTQLVQRAVDRGLTHLALTDHDSVGGVKEALEAADGRINIIPGAELSATWNNQLVHIVGLFLDIENADLKKFLEKQKEIRIQRAVAIGERMERQGFKNAYEE